MGKSFLISHGFRYDGVDPVHKPEGIEQIKNLQLPENIPLVIVGTGSRFQEIWEIISTDLPHIPVKYSPFCGSADGLDPGNVVILINGIRVDLGLDYLGLINVAAFDAWRFISDLPDRTLFCSGGELLISLGLKNIYKKGQLYELYPERRTGKKIS